MSGSETGAQSRRLVAFAMLGLLWMSATSASLAVAQEASDDTERLDIAAIDTFLQARLAETGIPGAALAITHGGEIVHLAGYGEVREGEPVTPETQFHIASVSKSVTALAVMQRVESGTVELDAPVVDYLPDFETAASGHAERVTVRHLLNQTSGLSYEGFSPIPPDQQPASTQDLVALMRDVATISEPGDQFDYFDPNYGISARLVEEVSGMTFEDYLERHVFSPLEMTDSFAVVRAEDAPIRAEALAQGHRLDAGVPMAVEEQGYLGGSGGVVSTARDLANYLILHTQDGVFGNHTLASPESMATMRTPPEGIDSPYAMGWVVLDPDAAPLVITNWGDLDSFRADLMLVPEQGLGIALLYNTSAEPSVFEDIRAGLIRIVTGVTPD